MNHITQFDFQQPVRVNESIMTIFHFRTQVKSNAGNKSSRGALSDPNFENDRPISHYDRTR